MKIVAISGGLGNQLFQYFYAIQLKQRYKDVYICKKFYDNQPNNIDKRIFELEFFDNDLIQFRANDFTYKYNSFFINKLEKAIWYFKHLILEKQKFLLINFNFYNFLFPIRFLFNNNYFYGPYHNKIKKNQTIDFIKFLDNLKIKNKYKDHKFKNYYQLISKNNSVAICIRRGDFLNFQANSSDQFFFKSINFLNSKFYNLSFFFFSDDMTWVKKNFYSKNFYFVDIKNKPSYLNIILISLCKHAVISNSTLHLCGASLIKNKNAMIIYEKEWKLAKKFNFIKFSDLSKS